MANEYKYANVDWAVGTPIAGERLATNGYFTGEYKGTPIQDEKHEASNVPHAVESTMVHVGTMLQDALDKEFPIVAE